jgi:hypothetical protein
MPHSPFDGQQEKTGAVVLLAVNKCFGVSGPETRREERERERESWRERERWREREPPLTRKLRPDRALAADPAQESQVG